MHCCAAGAGHSVHSALPSRPPRHVGHPCKPAASSGNARVSWAGPFAPAHASPGNKGSMLASHAAFAYLMLLCIHTYAIASPTRHLRHYLYYHFYPSIPALSSLPDARLSPRCGPLITQVDLSDRQPLSRPRTLTSCLSPNSPTLGFLFAFDVITLISPLDLASLASYQAFPLRQM